MSALPGAIPGRMKATEPKPEKPTISRFFDRSEQRLRWLDTATFWYPARQPDGSERIVRVECETGRIEVLDAPPDAPSGMRRRGATQITFVNRSGTLVELWWLEAGGARKRYARIEDGREVVQRTYVKHRWLVTAPDGTPLGVHEATKEHRRIEITADDATAATPICLAPDGSCRAAVRDHDVWLFAGSDVARLSFDGSADDRYDRLVFSPDGRRLLAWQVRRAADQRMHLVEAGVAGERPRLRSSDYLRPGDRIAHERPRLFDVAGRRAIPIDEALFATPWEITQLRWEPDSSRFTFLYNQRGHQLVRLVAVDAETGAASTLVEERSHTFVDYAQKLAARWLPESGELLWMSERDGWNHLYLLDGKSGAVKRQLTRGSWLVRSIEHVEGARLREVWFTACGLREGEDPYHEHLCRVSLDGDDFVRLTEGDGTHDVELSPGRDYVIDTWSRVDHPPVVEVRRAFDGSRVVELERGSLEHVVAEGWSVPERIVLPGRDGATDIHGILVKPTGFDPARSYPVLEEIYSGPQDQSVPKAWSRLARQQAFAAQGFVVVQIDGMGTNWRSKAFHDVAWQNLEDAGFPDRKRWIRAAAATRPWMDLSRVGIYGGSAGGQAAVRALLDHHDLYRVAVADCGCHDNRLDKAWWNELWLGWPVGEAYERASNVVHAARLQGHLMLIVGELDENVDPVATTQLAGALQRAGKDFELVVVVGAGHGAAETPFGTRKRLEFFARHLL
jgi:dipeptidyl-peptidase-4